LDRSPKQPQDHTPKADPNQCAEDKNPREDNKRAYLAHPTQYPRKPKRLEAHARLVLKTTAAGSGGQAKIGSFDRKTQLRAGKGILKVAREVGVGTGTVQRVAQEMDRPFEVAAA
jgi:hypothetical protein